MRNLDIIRQQIVELSALLSAYNHYLASYRSLTEVENTTQIQHNKHVATQSLNELKRELQRQNNNNISTLLKPQITKTIIYTQNEKNAILHFNKDKRFTITE